MSKRKKRRSGRKSRKSQRSTIAEHHRKGKTLTPPLASIPNLSHSSWRDDRLPEMLWAILLVTYLPRSHALNVFRELADYISRFRDEEDAPYDITLTGMSRFKPEILQGALEVITKTEDRKKALRPLLLFDKLPARIYWASFLGEEIPEDGWERLMVAVAKTLDHQSEESTDCRWARVICMIAAGKLVLPEELTKEFVYYPNYGDLRKVRPSIRAMEIGFSVMDSKSRGWATQFWSQSFLHTKCFPLQSKPQTTLPVVGTTPERVRQVYSLLVNHCVNTTTTTETDPKHDTVFGMGLYCLGILQELLRIGASQSITARLALRTLAECLITLTYLCKKDDNDLWKSYRVFGAGQAKLQFLKLEEMDVAPSYIWLDTLTTLANEDIWEEFLPIELGHWEKANLRGLSIQAGVKDVYDKYYGWTSTFAHGHWGAVRDAVYDTCGNPLHRLHRIPRVSTRALPDVVPDACSLVDGILSVISSCYPVFSHRVTIARNPKT